MEDSTYINIFFILLALIFFSLAIIRYYFRKCKKCGGKIRLEKHKDSMGHNLTKNITISIWEGPRRYKETFKCKNCGHEDTESYLWWN